MRPSLWPPEKANISRMAKLSIFSKRHRPSNSPYLFLIRVQTYFSWDIQQRVTFWWSEETGKVTSKYCQLIGARQPPSSLDLLALPYNVAHTSAGIVPRPGAAGFSHCDWSGGQVQAASISSSSASVKLIPHFRPPLLPPSLSAPCPLTTESPPSVRNQTGRTRHRRPYAQL